MAAAPTAPAGIIRLRPLVEGDPAFTPDGTHISYVDRSYNKVKQAFDQVFDEKATQKTVYGAFGKRVVEQLASGYAVTILAYGQSSSGKTYTLMGGEGGVAIPLTDNSGVLPRLIDDAMQHVNGTAFELSAIQVHLGIATDLLNNNATVEPSFRKRKLQESSIPRRSVRNSEEAIKFLREALKLRESAASALNTQSSRSHAVFALQGIVEKAGRKLKFQLKVVDLAGSEGFVIGGHNLGRRGERLAQETVDIQKSLGILKRTVHTLIEATRGVPVKHLPIMEHTLTKLLANELYGNCIVFFLGCMRPEFKAEGVKTLHFINDCRRLRAQPVQNEAPAVQAVLGPVELAQNGAPVVQRPVVLAQNVAPAVQDDELGNDPHLNAVIRNMGGQVFRQAPAGENFEIADLGALGEHVIRDVGEELANNEAEIARLEVQKEDLQRLNRKDMLPYLEEHVQMLKDEVALQREEQARHEELEREERRLEHSVVQQEYDRLVQARKALVGDPANDAQALRAVRDLEVRIARRAEELEDPLRAHRTTNVYELMCLGEPEAAMQAFCIRQPAEDDGGLPEEVVPQLIENIWHLPYSAMIIVNNFRVFGDAYITLFHRYGGFATCAKLMIDYQNDNNLFTHHNISLVLEEMIKPQLAHVKDHQQLFIPGAWVAGRDAFRKYFLEEADCANLRKHPSSAQYTSMALGRLAAENHLLDPSQIEIAISLFVTCMAKTGNQELRAALCTAIADLIGDSTALQGFASIELERTLVKDFVMDHECCEPNENAAAILLLYATCRSNAKLIRSYEAAIMTGLALRVAVSGRIDRINHSRSLDSASPYRNSTVNDTHRDAGFPDRDARFLAGAALDNFRQSSTEFARNLAAHEYWATLEGEILAAVAYTYAMKMLAAPETERIEKSGDNMIYGSRYSLSFETCGGDPEYTHYFDNPQFTITSSEDGLVGLAVVQSHQDSHLQRYITLSVYDAEGFFEKEESLCAVTELVTKRSSRGDVATLWVPIRAGERKFVIPSMDIPHRAGEFALAVVTKVKGVSVAKVNKLAWVRSSVWRCRGLLPEKNCITERAPQIILRVTSACKVIVTAAYGDTADRRARLLLADGPQELDKLEKAIREDEYSQWLLDLKIYKCTDGVAMRYDIDSCLPSYDAKSGEGVWSPTRNNCHPLKTLCFSAKPGVYLVYAVRGNSTIGYTIRQSDYVDVDFILQSDDPDCSSFEPLSAENERFNWHFSDLEASWHTVKIKNTSSETVDCQMTLGTTWKGLKVPPGELNDKVFTNSTFISLFCKHHLEVAVDTKGTLQKESTGPYYSRANPAPNSLCGVNRWAELELLKLEFLQAARQRQAPMFGRRFMAFLKMLMSDSRTAMGLPNLDLSIREALPNAKEEAEKKAKEEAEKKAKEEAEKKAKEEAEKKAKEEAEKKAKEEAEKKAKEEAEKKVRVTLEEKSKEEAEKKAQEEAERKPKKKKKKQGEVLEEALNTVAEQIDDPPQQPAKKKKNKNGKATKLQLQLEEEKGKNEALTREIEKLKAKLHPRLASLDKDQIEVNVDDVKNFQVLPSPNLERRPSQVDMLRAMKGDFTPRAQLSPISTSSSSQPNSPPIAGNKK